MARMPGAVWKPMPGSSSTRMSAYDVLCVHTCVGSLAGTDSWFRKLQDGTNSHFGVGGDGTIWQWVDTTYRSGASYNGNYHLISVECADMGAPFGPWAGSDVPAFTDAQIAALGRIARWVHDTHGIPLTQIPDSRAGRRGVGYHRLGVPGYMLPGTEQWSTKAGKVCPGNRRIAQIPQIIARAQQIANGDTDMLQDEREALMYIRDAILRGGKDASPSGRPLKDLVQEGTADAVWAKPILRPDDKGVLQANPALQELADIRTIVMAHTELIKTVAAAQGLSAADIEAAVAKALKENAVTVDVNVAGKGQA